MAAEPPLCLQGKEEPLSEPPLPPQVEVGLHEAQGVWQWPCSAEEPGPALPPR